MDGQISPARVFHSASRCLQRTLMHVIGFNKMVRGGCVKYALIAKVAGILLGSSRCTVRWESTQQLEEKGARTINILHYIYMFGISTYILLITLSHFLEFIFWI